MSTEDNNPAEVDTAVPVFPVTFFKDGEETNITDWRAQPVPADAVEDEAPKVSSAPEPVAASESQTTVEATVQVVAAPHPAEKVTTSPKVTSPGKPTSSSPKTTGS